MYRAVRASARSLLFLTTLGLAGGAIAQSQGGTTETGSLVCNRVAGTGKNFIITSKAEVRCIFRGRDGANQWYRGETGVGFGLDLKWTKSETINYGVLSSTSAFTPEGDFLTGNYGGAKADAAVGVGVGAAVLVGGSENTTALQPAFATSEGAGVSLGVSYLNIESDPLNVARMQTPQGDILSQALYSNYFNRALQYYSNIDYAASDTFAGRATDVARDVPVPPASPDAVADGDAKLEMQLGRAKLMRALGSEFAPMAPNAAAKAQVDFDCWVYSVEHELGIRDEQGCRNSFRANLDTLESFIAAEQRAQDTEQMLMRPLWLAVYFATDSSDVGEAGMKTVRTAVEKTHDLAEYEIYVSGHTDLTGTYSYNEGLSERRAESVRKALLAAGIPSGTLHATGYGKRNPMRITTNQHDALNRRVDIALVPIKVDPAALERARQKNN